MREFTGNGASPRGAWRVWWQTREPECAAPTALARPLAHPGLTAWANFWRASGAEARS